MFCFLIISYQNDQKHGSTSFVVHIARPIDAIYLPQWFITGSLRSWSHIVSLLVMVIE